MSPTIAASRPTRVLIVAPSSPRRAKLRASLAGEAELIIVDAGSGTVNVNSRPEEAGVVVVDLDDAPLTTTEIPHGTAGLVLIADNLNIDFVRGLPPGPKAVLSHNCDIRQIVAAIQAVAAGLTAMEPDALEHLLPPPEDSIALEPGDEELTPRETEVLHMMTAGLTNREIAAALGLSEHTVKFHISSILGKLGTSTRTEAVAEGIRRRLVLV